MSFPDSKVNSLSSTADKLTTESEFVLMPKEKFLPGEASKYGRVKLSCDELNDFSESLGFLLFYTYIVRQFIT